eukprot:4253377-Alexandrium_andersonii.AAC.1
MCIRDRPSSATPPPNAGTWPARGRRREIRASGSSSEIALTGDPWWQKEYAQRHFGPRTQRPVGRLVRGNHKWAAAL